MTLFLAFSIGFFSGLRSLTPPAIVAWAAHLGWLRLPGALEFMGSTAAVAIFTVLAVGEWAADKWWAKIPDRISAPALGARILTGALSGACISAAAGVNPVAGAAVGGIGGVVGAYSGFHARRRLVHGQGLPDLGVAALEDLVCFGGCVLVVMRLA